MAVAQVSLVAAVKAAPGRASAVSRRSARAVNVVAKAGVERFEVAKKAAPVALAVGASPPDPIEEDPDRCAVRSEPRGAPGYHAERSIARPGPRCDPGRFSIPPADPGARARFTNDRGSIHRPSTSRDRARSRENRAARSRAALTSPYPSSLSASRYRDDRHRGARRRGGAAVPREVSPPRTSPPCCTSVSSPPPSPSLPSPTSRSPIKLI